MRGCCAFSFLPSGRVSSYLTDSMRVPCGFHAASERILWLHFPRGFHAGSMRVPNGFRTDSDRVPCGARCMSPSIFPSRCYLLASPPPRHLSTTTSPLHPRHLLCQMHYIGLSCEAFFLITLVSMAIWLKEVPEECVKARWLHILLIVFPMLILEEALRSCYKYWRHLHDDRDPFADAGVAAMPASDDHSRDSLSDQPGVTKPTLQRLSTLQRFEEGVDLNVLMSSSMDWLRAQYSR